MNLFLKKKNENDIIEKIDGTNNSEPKADNANNSTDIDSPENNKTETLTGLLDKNIANESKKTLESLLSKTDIDNSPAIGTQTTLENITKDLLRPYLSEWLNENLQDVVEKIVQKEIKKILPND